MEHLDIVNEQDEVIGVATRQEVYKRKHRCRIVHVLIRNSRGDIALQLRARHLTFCPSHWSTTVGGHVQAGETYEQAALREFTEELGHQASSLTPIGTFEYHDSSGLDKFLTVFEAQLDNLPPGNANEVERVDFFSPAEINLMIKAGEKFHDELLFIIDRLAYN